MRVGRLPVRVAAVLWMGLGGCAGQAQLPSPVPVPSAPADSIRVTLFLVGDAGAPHPRFEPVLAALTADAAFHPDRTVVIYLGDNLYPDGMPDSTEIGRAHV